MSPGKIQEAESQKLDTISELSSRLLDLKKTHSWLLEQKVKNLKTKCHRLKKVRIEEYKAKSNELDEKEREICRKTTKLVDELASTCDDTPFHKALLKILENLKGKLRNKICLNIVRRT